MVNPLLIWMTWGLFDDDNKDGNTPYYIHSDRNDEPKSKSEKIKGAIFFAICVIFCCAWIYICTPRGVVATRNIKAKKQARNEILESAGSDAINSGNTVNLADYKIISESQAKRDSAYYAREVSHFIHIGGDQYLNCKLTRKKYGRQSVESYIDKRRLGRDPEFRKYLNGYKNSVEQLAIQRRISNQK